METRLQECRLFYRHTPPVGEGMPTILLLHGWGCDGSIFAAVERELAPQAGLLTVDFPGHGHSDEPPQPWGVPEYAEQIRSLLQQLGLQKVHIIAHSFGGRVAIYLASQHPQFVDRMIITGGAGIRKPPSEAQSKRQKQYKRYNAVLNVIKRFKPLSGLVEKLQDRLRKRYGSADYVKLNENMRKTFVKVISQDLTEMLPAVNASTLLVWGSADTETPLWMGQKMEQLIPDAGLVVFDGRTHFAFIEEWQRFVLIARQFFFGGQQA